MPDLPPGVDPRESFSNVLPGVQIAWDSVSLGVIKKCPRYYKLSIVDGWVGKGSSIHLRYGILYHRALEVYDHKTFEGMEHEAAIRFALRDLAEGCMDREKIDEISVDEGFIYGDDPWIEYMAVEGEPEKLAVFRRSWWNPEEGMSEDKAKRNTKTIPNLFRSVVWYLDKYGLNDPAKTVVLANGKPAVELSFRFELGFELPSGEALMYSGHLDRVVDFNGQRWVMDRKTTGSTITGGSAQYFFAQFHPDNQMTGYTLAGRVAFAEPVVGVIIDAVQIAKGFSAFERGTTMRTESELEEWREGVAYWVSQAVAFAQSGFYPMNEKSCNDYGGCAFRKICAKAPEVREIFLKSDFIKKPWDPLSVRGDI